MENAYQLQAGINASVTKATMVLTVIRRIHIVIPTHVLTENVRPYQVALNASVMRTTKGCCAIL